MCVPKLEERAIQVNAVPASDGDPCGDFLEPSASSRIGCLAATDSNGGNRARSTRRERSPNALLETQSRAFLADRDAFSSLEFFLVLGWKEKRLPWSCCP